MSMNSCNRLIELIPKHFPKINHVYAYGSAVVHQKDNIGKMIDLIFIVDNLKSFHSENLLLNNSHYSKIAKNTNINTLIRMNNFGTKVYYNPSVKIDDILIKYGIVEKRQFIYNLINWDNLFMSGRFHKPVLKLITSENENEIEDAIKKNIESAFSLVAISNNKLNKFDFFENIVRLSYLGDIRTYLKAEKKDKIHNIVAGAFDEYIKLYQNCLSKYSIVKNDLISFDEKSLEEIYNSIPLNFMRNAMIHSRLCMNDEEFRYYYLYKLDQIGRKALFENYIKSINFKYSCSGLITGLFSSDINKILNYTIEKYKKII